jgi:GTP cyclohydrolase I
MKKNRTPAKLLAAPQVDATEVAAIIEDRLLALPRASVDREQLQHHLREVLKLLHVDMEDENIRDTPRRWSESLVTMTSGYDYTDLKKLTTLFRKACSSADEQCQNLVVIGGTYKTLCAHHILPFFGHFIVGYIPEKMIIGASKIPRIVEVHMRRLQSQEHLAHDVADTIERILEPRGIAVWMGGVHLCMVMRGVEQESSFMETNVLRGEFRDDERTRDEVMSIVNRRGQRG